MRIDSTITLDVEELTRLERAKLLRKLTFLDANDIEVQAYDYYHEKGQLRLPRGVWSSLPSRLQVEDFRSMPAMPKLYFAKTLDAPGYDGQSDSVRAMFQHQQGQIIAPPGRGKTEIALAFAAAAKTRTLVVVHTNALFEQWVNRIKDSIPDCVPGKIQGKVCQVGHITIAMAQTLRRYVRSGGKFWRQFGCLIVDEAHHAAAETWSWLCHACPAFYRFGVTASEKRSDGRQPLVSFNIGPVIHKLKFRSGVPMVVRPVKSGFKTRYNGSQYNQVLKELVKDDGRNMVIAKLVVAEVKKGNTVLVFSSWIKHLELIQDCIALAFEFDAGWTQQVEMVTGRLPRAKQHELTDKLRDGSLSCILGTQLFEEGVDIPRLNRIILAFPGTDVTALQKVGRGARTFKGKTETVVYDIVDDLVRVLAKQYIGRQAWYRSVGIRVDKSRGKAVTDGGHGNQVKAKAGRVVQRALRVGRPGRV